ncbi:MAG: T9SS type A sorting domain-containing protein [Chitinophagales bacterium]
MLYKKLTLKGAVLRACGDTMWRGMYYAYPGATLVTTSDSAGRRTQIFDADYGARLEVTNGTYQLEKTDFINNRVGVYVNQVKPNSSSYIRGCNFYTSTDTLQPIKQVRLDARASYKSTSMKKMLYGIQLNLADGVVVGWSANAGCSNESNVVQHQSLNQFYNLHCGLKSEYSCFTVLSSKFDGYPDTIVSVPDSLQWLRTGIYSFGNVGVGKSHRQQIGDGTVCGMNYFSGNRFGINLLQNTSVDTFIINRNRFYHARLADVNVNSAQGGQIKILSNTMIPVANNNNSGLQSRNLDNGELAGDGVRVLNCGNSELLIANNNIVNVPVDSVYTNQHPFAKRACGIVLAGRTKSAALRRPASVENNTLEQSIYGIYSLYNDSLVIQNNSVVTRQTPYLPSLQVYGSYDTARMSDNVGIASTLDNAVVVRQNNVACQGTITGFGAGGTLNGKVTGALINSIRSRAVISCNQFYSHHFGILGIGSNSSGIDIRNNVLNGSVTGIAIYGFGSKIGNQGAALCGAGTGPCTVTASSDYTPDNQWINCVNHLGAYNLASGSNQQVLLRNQGAPAGLDTTYNPAMKTAGGCNDPNAYNSGFNQSGLGPNIFTARCAAFANVNLPSYSTDNCFVSSGGNPLVSYLQIQIPFWEKVVRGELIDTGSSILAGAIRVWRTNEIYRTITENQWIADSSLILDSFYQAYKYEGENWVDLKSIFDSALLVTDTSDFNRLAMRNGSIYPVNIQELNQQKLNSFVISYYNQYLGTQVMPDTIKAKLLNIAQQCYVTGGPSVFMARSLFWTLMNDIKWNFQDECIMQTGFYKTELPARSEISVNSSEVFFKIFPIPTNGRLTIEIRSSDSGEITVVNSLGVKVLCQEFSDKGSQVEIAHLVNGIYLYSANLRNGKIVTGKLIVTNK